MKVVDLATRSLLLTVALVSTLGSAWFLGDPGTVAGVAFGVAVLVWVLVWSHSKAVFVGGFAASVALGTSIWVLATTYSSTEWEPAALQLSVVGLTVFAARQWVRRQLT